MDTILAITKDTLAAAAVPVESRTTNINTISTTINSFAGENSSSSSSSSRSSSSVINSKVRGSNNGSVTGTGTSSQALFLQLAVVNILVTSLGPQLIGIALI